MMQAESSTMSTVPSNMTIPTLTAVKAVESSSSPAAGDGPALLSQCKRLATALRLKCHRIATLRLENQLLRQRVLELRAAALSSHSSGSSTPRASPGGWTYTATLRWAQHPRGLPCDRPLQNEVLKGYTSVPGLLRGVLSRLIAYGSEETLLKPSRFVRGHDPARRGRHVLQLQGGTAVILKVDRKEHAQMFLHGVNGVLGAAGLCPCLVELKQIGVAAQEEVLSGVPQERCLCRKEEQDVMEDDVILEHDNDHDGDDDDSESVLSSTDEDAPDRTGRSPGPVSSAARNSKAPVSKPSSARERILQKLQQPH